MTTPSGTPAADALALQQVLLAHEAAVFAYPVIGVHLDDQGQIDRARAAEQSHADLRDAVSAALAALGVAAPNAPSTTPGAIATTDAASARRAAVVVEERTASAYRYLLVARATAGARDRQSALDALTRTARDAAWWRARVTPNEPTVPFAGT